MGDLPPFDRVHDLAGVGPAATPAERRRRLRDAIADAGPPLVVPGVTDALGARLAERTGFGAVYATGAGLANAQFGLPDLGLVSQTEVVAHVERICAATALPVIVDADTGFGGPLAAMRTMRLLERAGAAGIQIEDQEAPKRCGHFDEHRIIPTGHMQRKLDAVVQARQDDDLVLVARTDARSVEGIEEAVRRARAYHRAGADVIFVEAPRTLEELTQVGHELSDVPLLVNVVEGGKTPHLSAEEYAALGFRIILHANFLLRAALAAGRDALAHLHTTGDTRTYDAIASWEERQALVNLDAFRQAETHYDQPRASTGGQA